jgi:hypothetical protein
MKDEPVLFIRDKNKLLKVDICYMQDWEGFEKLIKFVQKHYSASILAQYDGPDARRWILKSNHLIFELIHDDMLGNYFVASTKESESLVYEIGKNLESRLKKLK